MADELSLVLVSDLHGWLPEDLPGGDILVVAGDFCPIKDHSSKHQQDWLESRFYDWLHRQPFDAKVGIAGNHDFVAQRNPELVRDLPWYYLQDESVCLNELHIWGSPWCAPCGGWAFMRAEEDLRDTWAAAPNHVDLIVSHSPAAGVGDRVASGQAVGSSSLRSRILQTSPALHVCGHIHEARGAYSIGSVTRSINASLLDETYQPWGWCYQVDLVRSEEGWRVSQISEEPLDSRGYDFH